MRLAIAKPSYSPRPTPITLTSAFRFFGAALAWHVVSALVISLWYFGDLPFFRGELLTSLGWFWRWNKPWQILLFNLHAAGGLIAFEFLIGYIIWRISRASEPIGVALRDFVFCWWCGCLLSAAFAPVALLLAAWIAGNSAAGLIPIACLLMIAPAGLAPRILPTPQRWRPVCPECGHSVAFAAEPRCSECGDPYPCTDRFYRRWGILRLPWDQRRRSPLVAYVNTLFFIMLRPGTAAWRLANPDRMGRAVGWLLAHLGTFAILLLGAEWVRGRLIPGLFPSSIRTPMLAANIVAVDSPPDFRWSWALQKLAHALVELNLPTLIAIAIVTITPRLSSAVRRGASKWLLYAGIIPIIIAGTFHFVEGLSYLDRALNAPGAPRFQALMDIVFQVPRGAAETVAYIGSVIYWGIGFASQPYARKRGLQVFLMTMTVSLVLYGALLRLFDVSAFEALR